MSPHVRAQIPHGRVAELLARGWSSLGPGEEGCVLMQGPEIKAGGWRQIGDVLSLPSKKVA